MRVGAALGARDLVALARASRGLRGGALDPRGVGGAPGRGRWGRGALRLGRASGQGLGAAAGLLSNPQGNSFGASLPESVAPWRSGRPPPRTAVPRRSWRPLWRPPAGPPRKAARPMAVHATRPTTICTGPTTSACGRRPRGSGKAAGVWRGRSPRPGPPPSRGHSFGAGIWIDMRGPRLVKTKLVETKKTTRKEGERSRLCFGGDYHSPSTGENGKPLRESPLLG